MTDETTPPGEGPEPDATAAELALGLLNGADRATALRRVLAEPAFAAEVDKWRAHFGVLFDSVPDVAPPANGFARIERALFPAANDSLRDAGRPPSTATGMWRNLAIGSSIAAALLLTVVIVRPDSVAPVTPPPQLAQNGVVLVAQIAPVAQGAAVSAVYNPATGSLRVAAAALVDGSHSPELWVINGKEAPYSLGILDANRPTAVAISTADRARFSAGATLAVTIEPIGGSPSGKPTGAVVAQGALTLV